MPSAQKKNDAKCLWRVYHCVYIADTRIGLDYLIHCWMLYCFSLFQIHEIHMCRTSNKFVCFFQTIFCQWSLMTHVNFIVTQNEELHFCCHRRRGTSITLGTANWGLLSKDRKYLCQRINSNPWIIVRISNRYILIHPYVIQTSKHPSSVHMNVWFWS